MKSFVDLVSGPIDIGSVFESDGNSAESEATDGTNFVDFRHAAHGVLDWESNKLFDFDWAERRRVGQDLDLDVRKVRDRIERNRRGCDKPHAENQQREQDNDKPVLQRPADDWFNHDGSIDL